METLRCSAVAAFFVAVLVLKLGRVFLLCMSVCAGAHLRRQGECLQSGLQRRAGACRVHVLVRTTVQRLFLKPSDAPAQVECDVCRACSIQEAGCGDQGPGSDPYDCSTAADGREGRERGCQCCHMGGFFLRQCRSGQLALASEPFGEKWEFLPIFMSWRCRAWSPEKKVWCCQSEQKGCQNPDTPPDCDAGAGMVWKHLGSRASSHG